MLRIGKFLVFIALFMVFLGSVQLVSAEWPDVSLERCMNVTIANAGSSTLSNFPAYINLTHDSDMLPDFRDIRFYDSPCNQGGSQLDYEIENYTASDRAHVWVRIPSLPSAGTTISVYYKNSSLVGSGENPIGVWDSNYAGVWHMTEPNATDSTSNSNDGNESGGVIFNTSGRVDGADEFDSGNDYIDCGDHSSIQLGNTGTVEAWLKYTSQGDHAGVISKSDWAGDRNGYTLGIGAADNTVRGQIADGSGYNSIPTTQALNDNAWHHVVFTWDGSFLRIYVDGSSDTTPVAQTLTPVSDVYDLQFGKIASTGYAYYYGGVIDEARISNIPRSADWINQSYQIVADQANVVSFGSEEALNTIGDCSILNSAGESYVLTQDVWDSTNSTCMNIQADGVTLDCQGHRIDGVDGGSSYGVRINNYDNVIVRNCEVSDWAYGIQLSSSTGSRVYNNFVTSNTDRGINVISSSAYNNLTNNTVFLNGDYGIVFSSSQNNNFSHGNVSNNTNHGVYLSNADSNRIEYSHVGFNAQDGFNLDNSDGIVIYENNVTSNKQRGVYMTSSSGNRIEGGNVKANVNTGIWLYQSANNNVTSVNSSLNTNNGIYLEDSSNSNRVENCILFDNTANGFLSSSSSNNIVINIETYSNNRGVFINYGSGNNVSRSRINLDGSEGVRLTYTNNNYVIDSSINSSGSDEVYADDSGSSNNYFMNTTFDKNDVSISGSTIIWVRWYLQIEVRNDIGNPLGNANVSIKDVYNHSWFAGQTNSSGHIPRQILNEYNQTASGKSFYTSYIIDANKTGYLSNQTSENLTASEFRTIYLEGIGPPDVQLTTYTKALIETSIFKPNRMVRARASVTSGLGRDHVYGATIVIEDDTGTKVVDKENMTNVSEVSNGYLYEYNYTLPGDAQGLWMVNVTGSDIESRESYDFKKIAVTVLSLQVKLLMNDTWDSARVYIPGEGEKTFAQLGVMSPYSDSSPPHYYIASYSNNVLASLVVSPDNPLSISASTGSGNFELGTSQKFSNALVFLVFSKGSWRQVDNRMDVIEKGEFLSQISPSFSYGLGVKYPLKIVLGYDNLDINDTLSVGRGYSRISVENKGVTGNKVSLGIERV